MMQAALQDNLKRRLFWTRLCAQANGRPLLFAEAVQRFANGHARKPSEQTKGGIMGKHDLTSRGGAKNQDKNWEPFDLPAQTRFIHAGSAPLAKDGGAGLLLRYAKEDITVAGYPHAPKKFILAFALLDSPPGAPLPEEITLAKAAQLLWSLDEMPHVFVFTLDAGTPLWAEGKALAANREIGMAFDVLWSKSLVAEYRRTNKARAAVVY